MMLRSTRIATTRRLTTFALAVLGVSGWGAYAYSSWSAARTERGLQSQIARLTADRGGSANARKTERQETAPARTVYPSPSGASASTPTQVAAASPTTSVMAATRSPTPVPEPSTAKPDAPRTLVSEPAAPQPAAVSPSQSRAVPSDAFNAQRVESTTAGASGPARVDINAASVEDLNRLGGRFGRAIVASRPYTSVDELISKRVLTRSTFSQIKDQITAN
jgi:DNA uptake protein ComE-like DNA-binding protein